ncbi:duboraya isoform X2 [Dicentrarchus labrax]|uniref:duboraya isoform X2 n=1 Tax=Dicentrarchus labrax TaxID=13489 RepID=UPI0021F648ED|nr:duboraya isoform X2 [Dicentrarchus labrax]
MDDILLTFDPSSVPQEEAPSRRSVAELAGRFKASAPPHDAAGPETEKPVRRRPPRSLQLAKPPGDEQEPPGVNSLPAKAKRNSALIEKLQANLALSPSALQPSPKSPGFRLLSPVFPPPFPRLRPVTTVTTSSTPTPTSPVVTSPLTEEERPASFEAPPTVVEGSILSNTNIKGRPRLSVRRRPPSRRHRKSSSGEEVGVDSEGGDMSLSSTGEPEDKTTAGGRAEGGGGGGGGEEEGKTDETDAPTCPQKNHEEDQSEVAPREEDQKMKEEEEDGSTGGKEEEEKEEKNSQKQEEDLTEEATNTDPNDEEKITETTSLCSVR